MELLFNDGNQPTMMSQRILVVGSANIDYVVGVDTYPVPGETRRGTDLETGLGGKGANQAVAAGRLAVTARVAFAGQVGRDVGGRALQAGLQDAGVDTRALIESAGATTGAAMITRLSNGTNSIIIAPGANCRWSAEAVAQLRSHVEAADLILLQLEIPLDVVAAVADWARRAGKFVMLDPAPAISLPPELLSNVSLLTPNESEACVLLSEAPREVSDEELPKMVQRLCALLSTAILLKAGERGSFFSDGTRQFCCSAFAPGKVIDTTAAGDTFNGALAVAFVEQHEMQQAVRFAAAASGIAVTRRGAQASIPSRAEVDDLLRAHAAAFQISEA